MSKTTERSCVLVPCSRRHSWAIPQSCLGEIVTVTASQDCPPQEINWRGELVPVLDFGTGDDLPWRDPRAGSGLVAVLLGRRGENCQYLGMAVRGDGLGVASLAEDGIEDQPEGVQEYATAAFQMRGNVYQVPDIPALQRAVAGDGISMREGTHISEDRME